MATRSHHELTELDRRLLDSFQRGFPLDPSPFAAIAEAVGSDEETVLAAYRVLQDEGFVSRIGPVVAPHRAGWSTLAAMAVEPAALEETAARVSAHPAVNHNYEREHRLNLWFVVTAPDEAAGIVALDEIAAETGRKVIDLPLIEAFHIDLGFPIQWN
jgi:siroheme decarboxylase